MASLKITKFGGMMPRLHEKNLPQNMAQSCYDVDLSRGVLQPLRTDKFVSPVGGKSFYTDGCCIAASDDVCGTFARVYADCDYLVKADNSGAWVAKWLPSNCDLTWCKLGFDVDLPAPQVQVVGDVAADFNREMRQYYYTLVNANDWESEPSEVSDVLIADNDKDVIVSGLIATLPENVCADTVRIYCAVSGLDYGDDKPREAHFLRVDEVPLGTTVFVHKAHEVYGDLCLSENHAPPPRDLHSVAYADNGQLGGLSGDELVLSAPFAPYAFPENYRYGNFRGKPKRFVVSGNVGYVLTDGFPAVVELGSAPSEAGCRDVKVVDLHLPIVSYRSAAVYHGGCVYASRDGLVLLGGEQARVVSLDFMTAEQWQLWQPETLRGAIVGGWYVGCTDTVAFRFKLPDNVFDNVDDWHLTMLSLPAATRNFCVHDAGTLFFISDFGVSAFAKGNDFKDFVWVGRVNAAAGMVAWSAYKLVVDDAPVAVLHRAFKRKSGRLSADVVVLGDKQVWDSRAKRLKVGYAELDIDVRIAGRGVVSEYAIATSVAELGEK